VRRIFPVPLKDVELTSHCITNPRKQIRSVCETRYPINRNRQEKRPSLAERKLRSHGEIKSFSIDSLKQRTDSSNASKRNQ